MYRHKQAKLMNYYFDLTVMDELTINSIANHIISILPNMRRIMSIFLIHEYDLF